MEPVTHFLTGACLGRSGCNRKTAYATLAMVLAAEAPDIDLLWKIRGPVAEFEHHRGITHTLLGAPFMALLVTAFLWVWHQWRVRRKSNAKEVVAAPNNTQPVRWGWIWLFALIADLSHILLDWANNYGVRPFFPFSPHWYAGNILFIFEPVLFAALFAALIIPAILGLADREIGVRRQHFHGRGWAILALIVAIVLGGWRWAEHDRALHMLAQQNYQNETPLKMTVNPYPGDIFKWFGVVETRDLYQTTILNTRTDDVLGQAPGDIYYKQPQTPAILAAEKSWLGRVYLDWSQFPLVEEAGAPKTSVAGANFTKVRFKDLRYAYDVLFLHGRETTPLSATVIVAPDGTVDEMQMKGRGQK